MTAGRVKERMAPMMSRRDALWAFEAEQGATPKELERLYGVDVATVRRRVKVADPALVAALRGALPAGDAIQPAEGREPE